MRLELLGADGVFSAADAAAHGLDGHALGRLVRSGACVRLTRGWYAVASSVPPTPEGRHALTARALGRAGAARAVVSHYSALVLHGLPTYAVRLDTVHLTSLPRASGARVPNASSRRRGLVVHRPLPGLELERGSEPDPWVTRTVPVAWAVVQTGLVHGPESALVSADAALARGLVSTDQLARAVDGLAGHPGLATVRAALHDADALRRAGWVVVRLIWSDLADAAEVRRRVRRAMAQAAA